MDGMQTDRIGATMRQLERAAAGAPSADGNAQASFQDVLGSMLQKTEDSQDQAARLAESVARGEPQDLHTVMTAMAEADISFRMVLEVRNKLVDAWQEIKRMPI